MKLESFFERCNFSELTELEKVKHLMFYFRKLEGNEDFEVSHLANRINLAGFAKPNVSRLSKKLNQSKDFVKGKEKGTFKLSYKQSKNLETVFPELNEESEEISSLSTVLPHSLFNGTRGYIEKLSLQINASYENNITDGCAVLMRRLIEILLILAYDHVSKKNEIQDCDGELKSLNYIINYTVSNQALGLSKGTKDCLDIFRKLGNFAAHRIEYNCRKQELKNVIMEYRVAIEELLYKAGIKK